MQLLEIEAQRAGALPARGLTQHVGRDERVAVAIAADPAAHAQEGRNLWIVPGRVKRRERVLEGRVEARQFPQEGLVVE